MADPVREAADVIAAAIHDALCSRCHPDVGSGLIIRSLDMERAGSAVVAALQAADVQLAPPGSVVVQLPEPEDVTPVCGCATPPDGAPTARGCCRECMEPALVFFSGGISLDLQAGAIYDGTGGGTVGAATAPAGALRAVGMATRDSPKTAFVRPVNVEPKANASAISPQRMALPSP